MGKTGVRAMGRTDEAMRESREALIRAYKTILKEAVEARPSGMRLRIADLIGKNKSFVSQITNPNYKTPLPEKYVEAILDAVHLTPRERTQFLDVYRRAHPRTRAPEVDPQPEETRILRIELPRLESAQLEAKVDQLVIRMARGISDLARRQDES
jgi:hypothetical protein